MKGLRADERSDEREDDQECVLHKTPSGIYVNMILMRRQTFFLFAMLSLFAGTPPAIPTETKAEYWQAVALFNQTEAAFQSTLTDQQKRLMVEREQQYRAATTAREKVEKICSAAGMTLDPEEQKKNNLVCKEVPKPPTAGK
jgi:hypothetical protein